MHMVLAGACELFSYMQAHEAAGTEEGMGDDFALAAISGMPSVHTCVCM